MKKGVAHWNSWRRAGGILRPDLSGADLEEIDLMDADLTDADLRGANLEAANLMETELIEARLEGANLCLADLNGALLYDASLRGASLVESDLKRAQVCRADLREVDFTRTDLRGTDLRESNLTGAEFFETVFGNTNLQKVIGLDECKFRGPCPLDWRTVQKSAPLPVKFLQGCGFPDQVIRNFSSIISEFSSCFISYSSKDEQFVQRLHQALQQNGVRCWFAPHDIKSGRKLNDQIEEAIQEHDRLLLVLSSSSMRSDWVLSEILKARSKEKLLFPIRLVDFEAIRRWEAFDADSGTDLARAIREYPIPDFSDWQNEGAFKKALEKLLRDLKPGQ